MKRVFLAIVLLCLAMPNLLLAQDLVLLQSPSREVGEAVGVRPSTSGDWIAAGTASAQSKAASSLGSVDLFERIGTEWKFAQRLKAPKPSPDDRFGQHTAVSGDLLVVGAYGATGSGPKSSGEAHVYRLKNRVWTHEATLHAPVQEERGGFGAHVAIDGGNVFVGEARDLAPGAWANNKAIYEFAKKDGKWQSRSVVRPPADIDQMVSAADRQRNPNRFSGFGNHFDVKGDWLVAAAMGTEWGNVFLYQRKGSAWELKQTLSGPMDHPSSFGRTTAIDGDTLVVGALRANGEIKDVGLAYVYRFVNNQWALEDTLAAPNAKTRDMFGHWVDLEGNTILVGAFRYTGDGEPQAGAAFVYKRVANKWMLAETMRPAKNTKGKLTAYSVGLANGIVVFSSGDELGAWDSKKESLDAGGVWVKSLKPEIATGSGSEVPTKSPSSRPT
jgi:hypothetical protein